MAVVDISNTFQMSKSGAHIDNTDVYNSNRNLLDNPFFSVNQRGFTSVTGTNGVYTVDRWKINNGGGTGGTISVTSQGYIQLTTGSAYVSFQQMFGGNELAGKTVTMSVNDNGTIYSHSFTVPTRGSADVTAGTFVFKTGCSCHFFVMKTSSAYGYNFQLSIGQGYSATIRAVKLELGSYSTLANDVPPNYQEELAKCQYYFRRIKCTTETYAAFGYAVAATAFRVTFPYTMRIRPSISTGGTLKAYYAGGNSLITAWALGGEINDILQIGFTTTGLTPGSMVALSMASGAYIDLSADL